MVHNHRPTTALRYIRSIKQTLPLEEVEGSRGKWTAPLDLIGEILVLLSLGICIIYQRAASWKVLGRKGYLLGWRQGFQEEEGTRAFETKVS